MRLTIHGGHALHGTYPLGGNPNAAKALVAAALLTSAPVTLHGVPHNTSTQHVIVAARALGARIEADEDTRKLRIHAEALARRAIAPDIVGGAVGTLLLLAPLLARRQHARLVLDLPLSRVRTHLDALRDLGQHVHTTHGAVEVHAARWADRAVLLDRPSVTATALVLMLAACLGERTTLHNAACEPHIVDLADLLTAMGARVDGAGTNRVVVDGTPSLGGAHVSVRADHIEAASVAVIAALCGGRVQLSVPEGVAPLLALPDLRPITRGLGRLGVTLDADTSGVFVPHHDLPLRPPAREEDTDAALDTAPWPGFPSDMVALATVAATQAQGTVLIHETLFKDRLLFVDTLKDMGAQIILCDPHRAIVVGAGRLRGTYIAAPDARTGLGLLGAALVADGESVIDNAQAFDYTFDGVLQKLLALDAHITLEADA